MTNEEAIKRIDDLKQYLNQSTAWFLDDTHKTALDLAISALKGEWIPVAERLPENDTDVLYCSRLRTVGNCHYFNGFNNYPNTTPDYIFEDIIAWLPLPEPYKEGGEV